MDSERVKTLAEGPNYCMYNTGEGQNNILDFFYSWLPHQRMPECFKLSEAHLACMYVLLYTITISVTLAGP